MRSKLLGLGLGLTLSALGVVAVPTMAFADATCYTGCTTPLTGVSTPVAAPATGAVATTEPAQAPIEPKQATATGLALTGADIEGMVAIGAGALVVGGLMVRRSRRLHRATA